MLSCQSPNGMIVKTQFKRKKKEMTMSMMKHRPHTSEGFLLSAVRFLKFNENESP